MALIHRRYSTRDLRLQDARIHLFRAELALMRKPGRFDPETDAARDLLRSRDRLVARKMSSVVHTSILATPGQ